MNRNWLGFAVALTLLGGCGSDDEGPEQICVPGAVDRCNCSDGDDGVRTCRPDGSYGGCACGAAENTPDENPRAGTGAAGDGTSGSGGGAAGTGGMSPAEEPTMSDGGAQTPPDAESPADAGATPEEKPPPEEEPPPPKDPPPPGALYGPCRSSDDCRDRLQCAGNQAQAFGGSDVGYCAERCLGSSGQGSGNTSGTCTEPETGTTEVSCSPFSGVCELGTCERTECPVGMVCQELSLDTRFGFQTVYACAYPD